MSLKIAQYQYHIPVILTAAGRFALIFEAHSVAKFASGGIFLRT
jgi:hypothetical protein